MGKEKDKDKKDKDKKYKDKDKKDKDKEKKDKKDKDKDKDKKGKDKDKDKNKDKKDKDKFSENQEWKLLISKHLDNYTHAYEKITNKFRDIDNYILKDANSKKDFIEKVKKTVEELPEPSQQIFLTFLKSIE